ncbi:MAG: DUF1926 domain-containing protein, partial [Acidobacteriota bacterium]|nr:DUF1926 domain-containing protein [Acidobacteriota bacterium]
MTESKVSLCMVIHSHQPVGNFDHVIEQAYQKSYLPFLETLAAHPRIRLCLHYSGILWEWIEAHHPEFLSRARELTDRGQVEHAGGGYFEPILAAIPDAWKLKQIRRQTKFLQDHFGVTPRGAWIAERVWEQGLITPLIEAGVEYTILDDTHFLAAGEEAADLHQVYLTEESGAPLKLVPSVQSLRYTIPFRDPSETLAILQSRLGQAKRLVAVGDDCEKFGVWPGTYEHCYVNGWLERFFQALENAGDWLEVTTVSDYIRSHPPARRIYLPSASYAEMMMWALPAAATEDLEACVGETGRMADGAKFRRFLRGGPWRNFLSKYPESNQMQKFMLRQVRRWTGQRRVIASGSAEDKLLLQAEDCLLAAQCNDPYWHGIFGGLYAPHLRSAVQHELIRAESLLDQIDADGNEAKAEEDFDADGNEEILISNPKAAAIIRPADGGTISSLRSKTAGIELINSLKRRPEAYHRLVSQKSSESATAGGVPASIHDSVHCKESNLGGWLRYDRYARNSFRVYLFPRRKTWRDFDSLALEEHEDLAQGGWEVDRGSDDPSHVKLTRPFAAGKDAQTQVAEKSFKLTATDDAWEIDCGLGLSFEGGE